MTFHPLVTTTSFLYVTQYKLCFLNKRKIKNQTTFSCDRPLIPNQVGLTANPGCNLNQHDLQYSRVSIIFQDHKVPSSNVMGVELVCINQI